MNRQATGLTMWAVSIALAAGASARGGHFDHIHGGGTPPPGRPICIPHTHERAGYPLCLSDHAAPTNTEKYCGHYVGGGGGGLFHRADPRCRIDGTWGWDYVGGHVRRNVFLGWNHGRRYQGGIGAYRTDPYREVPNIFATELPKLHHHHGGEGNGEE